VKKNVEPRGGVKRRSDHVPERFCAIVPAEAEFVGGLAMPL